MNKIIIIAFLISFASCASSQEEQNAVKEIRKTQTVQTTSKPKPRINYIKETGRPKSEINQNYPYDIDLKMADGKVLNSSEILKSNGKPTVVLFWLTTCVPCRYEMKAIHEKYERWTEEADFNLIAISTDFQKNYESFVKKVNESGWKWDTYNDVNREFRHVLPGELNGLPQTFIFDKNGEIVYHKRKYRSGDEDALFEKVKSIAMK